ncbi:threonine/serine exporter family protein [Bifidobacterium bifidum]|uniref:Threonine/serine exporter family protein n=1 Tax=Bifidobacterium bifidum TaxID=1681 RepID=A0A415C454_BIFBI|nr:threonine/serine exporter family protein [Bifidobacterium bifidum]RHJ05804.1 threonine/serine exporter family protein [Bifidobacterium bifidum]RHJ23232.1 threonine/serine exporter family protein [Bifidobacterium bifidum]
MQQHMNGDAPHQDAATAVSHFHTHSVPLDMEDIRRDWDKPISEAGLAAKTSVVVRVGALDLGAGTGSFRVREMMHRIAYPLGVHVRADVNLTDIEATCTDDANRITEVIDLPTTGVNTERIWLLEHYTDWFSVNLGLDSMYHRAGDVSEGVVQNLEQSDMSEVSAQLAKKLRAEKKAQKELSGEASDDPVLDALEAAEVTVPVSMVRAAAADIAAEGSTDDELRSESEAVLEEDREAKLLHDWLMQQRSGKHDFVETPDLDAAAAAAGGAGAGASSAEDQNLNEFGTSMSAEALLGAKRRKTRAHKPLTGEYAEHFDHVGRSAGEGRKTITVRQAHERLDLIESRKPLYSPAFAGFASAVACASFVFLLGGGPYDMIGAFVGAGLGHWLRRKLFARHLNQFFVTFVCVALAALACTGTLRLIGLLDPIALTHDTAYIGAMLFVIPGFPLITGGLDMAKIDFPSGIQRVAYVLCIILMATLAGWGVAMIVHLNPTGFEPLGLNPWVNTGLRAVTAFLGVWGFSIMFNSPQRMCLVAATIGMITDTLRLTLVDFGVPAEAGAFIGALLAGLLAAGWRTAVHNGLLPPHLGYPRICLTVPSIVIMVPGLYMYRAMFYLGQFDTLHALDWAFRAFMVIICLPIGLAMARVITDKSWRYDV